MPTANPKPAPKTLKEFIARVDKVVTSQTNHHLVRMTGYSMPGDPMSDKGILARQLESLFLAVQSAYPDRSTRMPSGKYWLGTELPEGWSDAQVLMPSRISTDEPTRRASLLHLASVLNVRPKWVGWLLASGVSPLKYCQETGNAPLGQMAYTGNHEAVRVVRRAGFDLSMRLLAEHLDMSSPVQARQLGTTLLHRLANRSRFQDERARRVIDELLRSGLSPTDPTAAGETPINLCPDPALREYLERHVAKKSRRLLQDGTNLAPARTASAPRL